MKLSGREIELQQLAKNKRDRLNAAAGAGMRRDMGRTVDQPRLVAKKSAKKTPAKNSRKRG